MTEYTNPSRQALIIGAAIIALRGLEDRFVEEARRNNLGKPDADYNDNVRVIEIRELIDAVKNQRACATDDVAVTDMLAYAQQTLRVSHDEWESLVRVRHQDIEPGPTLSGLRKR
jgi:hypothetical protein